MKRLCSLLLALALLMAGVAALAEAPVFHYDDKEAHPTLEAAAWCADGRLMVTVGGYESNFIVVNGGMYLPYYPYVVAGGEKYTCAGVDDMYDEAPSFYFECPEAPEEIWIEPLFEEDGEPMLLAEAPEIAEAAEEAPAEEAPALEINPLFADLAIGMDYDAAAALVPDFEASQSDEGLDVLGGDVESWGQTGYLTLRFDANRALNDYEWYFQVGLPSCSVLSEDSLSESAAEDSEALYQAMCADMAELAGGEADKVSPLSYLSDGSQYMMTEWTESAPQRRCVWIANRLDLFICRFVATAE